QPAAELSGALKDIRAEMVPGAEKVVVENLKPVVEKLDTTVLKASPVTITCRPDFGFDITYRWQAKPLDKNYSIFVHFVDKDGKTLLQDDHAPPTATTKWDGLVEYKRTVYLPRWIPRGTQSFPGLTEGKYKICVGLSDERGRKILTAGEGVVATDDRRYEIGELVLDKNAPLPELPPKTLDLTGYKMTFNEEFNDLSVSTWGPCGPEGTRWIAKTPYRGNFGDARFSEPTEDFPFTVKDGILRIEAKKMGTRWHSGLLASVDPQGKGFSQKFGYFEMRAKFPEGPGTWPAFWLHGVSRVTNTVAELKAQGATVIEIDVLEQYGHWPNKYTCAIHQWSFGRQPSSHEGKSLLVPGMTEDFNTYGALITEEHIIIYFNGSEIRREKTPECAKVPLYIMVDLAMGPGWPLDKTPSPQYMYVDYVRAYAKE
ncbi:MAG TPA: glycoside hydrolase family 16 protein, partial [Phycisphaerae bacterium]|nr:glycoside hydrolase family 16 protein [Phycisphaerae bacterium]